MTFAESSSREAQSPEEEGLGPKYKSTAKPKAPLTPEQVEQDTKPKVLISGGGIAGLMLAILLHKARVPFLVFERAKEIKPL
ncbi:hypothetical protein BGZ94_006426, partial [Podila epigama]